MTAKDVSTIFKELGDFKKAKLLSGFFKTGPGEYGAGDVFIGVMVPQTRRIAKQFCNLPVSEIKKILSSKIHEERLCALLILVHNFSKGDEMKKKDLYNLYLSQTKYINNWDLVDLSAPNIVGAYLYHSLIRANKRMVGPALGVLHALTPLARSESIWERRIAVLATFTFIKNGRAEEALHIADILLHDSHDLIHKAVGWMLREVGKRCSVNVLEEYLHSRYKIMPRTMLRYAIEHFPKEKRGRYLSGKV